jgi:two-component system, NtrC family, nitrogen regulation sensor histidine kinase NtrY
MGEIAFLDRPGGGTHVRISFDTHKLAALASEQPDENPENNDESDEEA